MQFEIFNERPVRAIVQNTTRFFNDYLFHGESNAPPYSALSSSSNSSGSGNGDGRFGFGSFFLLTKLRFTDLSFRSMALIHRRFVVKRPFVSRYTVRLDNGNDLSVYFGARHSLAAVRTRFGESLADNPPEKSSAVALPSIYWILNHVRRGRSSLNLFRGHTERDSIPERESLLSLFSFRCRGFENVDEVFFVELVIL
jgi:hypothetical protein